MGGSSKAPSKTTQEVTQTNVPAYLEGPMRGLAANAAAVAARPYEAYRGPRIAGFNGYQNQAMGLASALPGQVGGMLNDARARMAGVDTEFGADDQARYMNPYTSSVIDATQQRAQEDFMRQQNSLAAQKAKTGTWGGSRFAIQSAIGDDMFNKTMMEQRYKGLADAYDKSYNMWSGDRGAAMQQATGLGQMGAQYGSSMGQAVNQLGQMGDERQAVQQVGLDTAYQDFINQRDNEKNNLDWLSSIYHGFQGSGGTSTTTTSAPSSNLQSALGLGLAGLGAYQSMR